MRKRNGSNKYKSILFFIFHIHCSNVYVPKRFKTLSELSWWTFGSENVKFVNVIKDTTDPVPADGDISVLDLLEGIKYLE